MNKGSNSSHISAKNTCDYLSQLKAQADEERSSTTAGYISNTATEDSFKSLTRQYHYDEQAKQVPNRARDSENRGTSASKVEDESYKSDVLIYDVPVTREKVTVGKTTMREDEVYHSHVIHKVDGLTSTDIYNGVNYKAQKLMDQVIKDPDERDSSKFKSIEAKADPLVSFTQPWTLNTGGSDNIHKQAQDAANDLAEAMLRREEYRNSHSVEFTKDYSLALKEVLKEEKPDAAAKMSTSELKATRDKAIEVKMAKDSTQEVQSTSRAESSTDNLVSYFNKSFETSSTQQSKVSSSSKLNIDAGKTDVQKYETVSARSFPSYISSESESAKQEDEFVRESSNLGHERTNYSSIKDEDTSTYASGFVSSNDSTGEAKSIDSSTASNCSSDSSFVYSSCEDKEEEDHSAEAEAKRSSCSWWYHGRCLQDGDDCYNCSSYDPSIHNCSNCNSFCSQAGSNRKGDSWYGICEAYGGNPIRHDPSCHTCKAWN